MPFVDDTDLQSPLLPPDPGQIFVGRDTELSYFKYNILQPEKPSHNIVVISGQGGVGKTTLLSRFMHEAAAPAFRNYCLTAKVDHNQTTPAAIMETLATQLQGNGGFTNFKTELENYNQALKRLQQEKEAGRQSLVGGVADWAGQVIEDEMPFGKTIGRAGRAAARGITRSMQERETRRDVERLTDPIRSLTKSFVEDLNQLAKEEVKAGTVSKERRSRRIVLLFDTFEQLGVVAAPWLLDYLLQEKVNRNVVLVLTGRDALDRIGHVEPKRWLDYRAAIQQFSLNTLSKDQTTEYLKKLGITEPERVVKIWQLSKGLPLFLSFFTFNLSGEINPTADVVENFLCWIPEEEKDKRNLALEAALFSRPFRQDDLEAFSAYIPEDRQTALYQWLIGLPFVLNIEDGRHVYHDLAQELFTRYLYQTWQKWYYNTRRELAGYYQKQLERLQFEGGKEAYQNPEWLEVALAAAKQYLLLPGEAAQVQGIEWVLAAYHRGKKGTEGRVTALLEKLAAEHSVDQAHHLTRSLVKRLQEYTGDGTDPAELLVASDYLLERIGRQPTFSAEMLARIYNSRGVAYSDLKEYEKAIRDYDKAIELDPADAAAYNNRGVAYYELKEYEKAIRDYDKAIELNPAVADAYNLRGLAYDELKEYEKAIRDYDKAIELNPASTYPYNNRGIAYRNLKEYEKAIRDYDKAIELDPADASTYNNRGNAFYYLKEYEKAIRDYDKAIELDPADADAYINRGLAYRNLKEYEKAIRDYDKAIELNPAYTAAYNNRGNAYLLKRELRQARSDFARSFELEATNVNNGWMAEWAGMCLDTPVPALDKRLEEIAAVNPQQYMAFVCRGVACWLRGEYEEALTEFEGSLEADPEGNWDAHFWKGMTLACLGREEEAEASIEKALEMELPTVLILPLRWLENINQGFYHRYAAPLLARRGVYPATEQ